MSLNSVFANTWHTKDRTYWNTSLTNWLHQNRLNDGSQGMFQAAADVWRWLRYLLARPLVPLSPVTTVPSSRHWRHHATGSRVTPPEHVQIQTRLCNFSQLRIIPFCKDLKMLLHCNIPSSQQWAAWQQSRTQQISSWRISRDMEIIAMHKKLLFICAACVWAECLL